VTEPDNDLPIGAPRPEPVLNAAKVAGAVSGLVVAVGAAFVLAGLITAEDVAGWAQVAGGIVLALGALVSAVTPMIAARGARAKVTPTADPRDSRGRRLIPVVGDAEVAVVEDDQHGRHEADRPPPPYTGT
jgi:hypothetical protein